MKLFMASNIHKGASGGVVSVMNAHEKLLGAMGVEYVNNEKDADLVIVHALGWSEARADVYHSHGVYPTAVENWGPRFDAVNMRMINYMLKARAVVSVSELAAEFMRRDLHIQPHLIRNGVDFSEIKTGGKKDGRILWPKLKITPTCDPSALIWLAENTKYRLGSMAKVHDKVHHYGELPRPDFLTMMSECSIYLGITRENNPMAVMEAMATGLPLVGYNCGFNREWLVSGNGCELVELGDLEGLALAIDKVLNNYREYSRQSREYARSKFGWDEPIQEIYNLYQSLLTPKPADTVSVVIPLHNYANWVGEAIQSAKDQTVKPLEIIVVDDASTDKPIIPKGVKLIQLDKNVGVATARNIGIEKAKGYLIICLDADDKLEKDYIQRALPMFKNPRIGIAYGPLSLMDENGELTGKRWFGLPFNWHEQAMGRNQVPTCAMFRKEAWQRAGGYRKYESPAEDAGLWTRIASQGWRVEFINDGHSTLYYRMHENSLSRTHKFPDWVSGREWKRRNAGVGHPVQIYDCPKVSYILDYSKDQEQEFIQAVDSIEGLKDIDWEICATGKPSPLVRDGFPFVRWGGKPSSITAEFPI